MDLQMSILGLIMFVQNMTFTWASRARNSGSLWYTSLAMLAANATFVMSLGRMGNQISQGWMQLYYVVMTTSGGVLMVWLSQRYLEQGNRRVGGDLADRIEILEKKINELQSQNAGR